MYKYHTNQCRFCRLNPLLQLLFLQAWVSFWLKRMYFMDMWWHYAIIFVICTSLVFFRALESLQGRLKRLPPGPPGLPIVGNLLQLGSKPNETLQALARTYGPIMSLSLGMKTVVVVSSPDMAREILKTHDRDLAGRDAMESSKVKDYHKRSIIFGQPGDHRTLLRRICTTELFSAKKLTELRHLRRRHIRRTVHRVYQQADGCTVLDLRNILQTFTLDLLGTIFFSTDMFHPESEQFNEFKDYLARVVDMSGSPNIVDYLPFLRALDPQRVLRDTESYMEKTDGIIDSFIHNRVKCPHSHSADKDFLDILLGFTGSDFTLSDIRVLLGDLFAAGSDPTTASGEWAMAELIRNPRVMAKAESEMDEVIGKERILEEEDFESLPYLRAVVKETVRLHPAAPLLIPHKAERQCDVAGFSIPKNTTVIVNFSAIARDPCVWGESESDKFIPERFVGTSVEFKGRDFEFIPFGSGRRICVGMPLASIMLHSLVGALIQCFEWRLPDGVEEVDMEDKFGVTLHKSCPLVAVAKPRLHSAAYREE